MAEPLRVLECARTVVTEIAGLMAGPHPVLPWDEQLVRAARAITANIREGYGRRKGAERNQFLRYARASADEADEHLRFHRTSGRLPDKKFWGLSNKLAVIRKMLTQQMA